MRVGHSLPRHFETAIGFTPRQLLRACDEHRQRCIAEGKVLICTTFSNGVLPSPPAPSPTGLNEVYFRERGMALVDDLLDPANEERLYAILAETLAIYARQLELPDDIDVASQRDPDQQRPSLHGRLTFIFRSEADREQHFCFRIISHANAIAFQSRLRAAMTASGVDRALGFRHLFILRDGAPPSGAKTKQLFDKFEQAGGRLIVPTKDDLRAFIALCAMADRKPDGFDAWLRASKPLFETSFFKAAGLAPPEFLPLAPGPGGAPPKDLVPTGGPPNSSPDEPAPRTPSLTSILDASSRSGHAAEADKIGSTTQPKANVTSRSVIALIEAPRRAGQACG